MSKATKTRCPAYLEKNGVGFCPINQEPCPLDGTLFDEKCISPGKIYGEGKDGIERILEIGPGRYELEKLRKKNEKLYE